MRRCVGHILKEWFVVVFGVMCLQKLDCLVTDRVGIKEARATCFGLSIGVATCQSIGIIKAARSDDGAKKRVKAAL